MSAMIDIDAGQSFLLQDSKCCCSGARARGSGRRRRAAVSSVHAVSTGAFRVFPVVAKSPRAHRPDLFNAQNAVGHRRCKPAALWTSALSLLPICRDDLIDLMPRRSPTGALRLSTQPLADAPLFKTPAQASKGMVCTNHPIASAAGVEMFAVVNERPAPSAASVSPAARTAVCTRTL